MIVYLQPTREKKMVENFGGSLNLIIWIIATLGAGYYSYRCLFGMEHIQWEEGRCLWRVKAWNDQ